MELYAVIIVIPILIHTSSAYHHIDPQNHILTYEWNGDINEASNINKHVNNRAISDIFAGEDHHSIALLNCDFTVSHDPKYCNLTIQTHNFYNIALQTIFMVSPPSEKFLSVRGTTMSIGKVKFLKRNVFLIGYATDYDVRINASRIYYQLIAIDTFETRGFATVDDSLPDKSAKGHSILAYDDHFDIVFHDRRACRDHDSYCRVSHGNNIEKFWHKIPELEKTKLTPEDDSLILNELYPIKAFHNDAVVVIGQVNVSESSEYEHVYSPIVGWRKIKAAAAKLHSYSNTSGHATLCWSSMNKMKAMDCMWLDGTREIDDTLHLRFSNAFERIPHIHNKPDGNILLVRAATDLEKNGKIVIDQGYMDGQCKRLAEMEVHDVVISEFELTLIQPDIYCVSYLGKKVGDLKVKSKQPNRNAFVTRCVQGQNEEVQEFFDCGDQRYYV